ncbi:unnamed protein product [Spirodela intermedia]|uniref:Alpha 1,4-glycosyltransferase domain-containing protein n=1 Tax=Spirodela intermedia TaxID=51605 RepID=A0A7I8JNT9_SPIIN|nr:unnamed protein product [Spirodela intermedia]CAA6671857.1 unnamed protein product [Spirodela intermedia]
MLRSSSGRRRSRYGSQLCCAAVAAFLLLLSISVLHSRLSSSSSSRFPVARSSLANGVGGIDSGVVLHDVDNDVPDDSADDLIDALDVVEEAGESEDEVAERGASDLESGGFFWDHSTGVMRRSFGRPRGHRWRPDPGEFSLFPVDEEIRSKLASIRSIEDALLLKVGSSAGGQSPLREGWAPWFEAKGRFLKQDKMFTSSVEQMNPMNHPLLQDPDGPFLTGLTRGDRLLQKAMMKELQKTPFIGEPSQRKRIERKALGTAKKPVPRRKNLDLLPLNKIGHHVYPDNRHWGYYPGLEQHSSFSEFVDRFLYSGQCSLRVFMVWNSPPWAYGIRHQRGLESLLHHNKDACVLVFSETLELDFFTDFVKDGFRIAVAMPNLDELLKDTPVYIFASVWFKWRKTKHYTIHYSELIRLAALYKYGGVYLDTDVIVLKPLSSLKNSIGMENEMGGDPIFNGAVMAFDRHSRVIMECLKEFHSTYDDTRLRWNGAELLTRVIRRLAGKANKLQSKFHLNMEPFHKYFSAPVDEVERAEQSTLLAKTLNESTTFHFWNGLTFSLVPETDSLSEKLINRYCLRCLDVL